MTERLVSPLHLHGRGSLHPYYAVSYHINLVTRSYPLILSIRFS
jgi:hypothetical protein